jgi:hypothetical protein
LARPFAAQVTGRWPFPREFNDGVVVTGRWDRFTCREFLYNSQHSFDVRCVRGAQVIHWQGGD